LRAEGPALFHGCRRGSVDSGKYNYN
jgi:hypothetical protein